MSLQALLGESRTDRIKGCAFYSKYNILNVILVLGQLPAERTEYEM